MKPKAKGSTGVLASHHHLTLNISANFASMLCLCYIYLYICILLEEGKTVQIYNFSPFEQAKSLLFLFLFLYSQRPPPLFTIKGFLELQLLRRRHWTTTTGKASLAICLYRGYSVKLTIQSLQDCDETPIRLSPAAISFSTRATICFP